jgi:hypothetical protein
MARVRQVMEDFYGRPLPEQPEEPSDRVSSPDGRDPDSSGRRDLNKPRDRKSSSRDSSRTASPGDEPAVGTR